MSPKEPPRSTSVDSGSSPVKSKPSAATAIENIVMCYGDLIFDFCESLLWNPLGAQIAFRAIVKDIRKRYVHEIYSDHERAWVLHLACSRLRTLSDRHARKLTPPEQIELDAVESLTHRLKQFDSFFHRLSVEDQMLLLLRDKYGIPFPEIATAMGAPEGSLKTRRSQALRTLEDWLWERA